MLSDEKRIERECERDRTANIVGMLLSDLPENLEENQARVLLDCAFGHTEPEVAVRYDMTVRGVQEVKRRHRDIYESLQAKKKHVLKLILDTTLYDMTNMVLKAQQNIKMPTKWSEFTQMVNSLAVLQRIRLDLEGLGGTYRKKTQDMVKQLGKATRAIEQMATLPGESKPGDIPHVVVEVDNKSDTA